MALQQSSLNFDFAPEEKKPEDLPVREEGNEANRVDKVNKVDRVDEANEANKEYSVDNEVRDIEFLVAEKVPDAIQKSKEKKSTRGRMSLKEMDILADLIEVPEDAILFEKRYYSIGAVSEMFKVNVSLIRFWENEFDILKPKKNGKGDRLFRPEDVKNLQLIHHLLRKKKYTIEGAKDFLRKNKKAEENFALIEGLQKIKVFLNELKANL